MPFEDFDTDSDKDRETHRLPHARREEIDTAIEQHNLEVLTTEFGPESPDHFFDFQDEHKATRFIANLVSIDGELTKLVITGIKYRGPPEPDVLVDFIKYFNHAHEVSVEGYDGETVKLRAWFD